MNEIFWKATEGERFEFFLNMSDQEARSFFEQYLQLRDQRLAILNHAFSPTGGGNEYPLNYAPESLRSLWRWATPRLHRREYTDEELEHIVSLPEWFKQHHLANRPLTEDTLILINDIAYYLGEVVIRNLKGVHWSVCKADTERYVDQNQPVLAGFSGPGYTLGRNPRSAVAVTAVKTVDGKSGEDALLQVYVRWSKHAGSNAAGQLNGTGLIH